MKLHPAGERGVHILMRKPDVKKRLKSFNSKISEKIAKNETLVNAEDTPEVWHLNDTADLEDIYFS